MKLQKGDEIQVVAGKDKGKTGKIEALFPKLGKVIVTGINQYKRHTKARSQNQPSEIVTITKPLPVSNIQFVCPKCKLITRIGFISENEKKVRICKKCGQLI